MRKFLIALSVATFIFILPMITQAADLVPECGGAGEPTCQACYFVELVNNVVSWLVLILGTIAAILIVVAGAKLVTSGGNASAKESAKSMMTNLIIGYLIVLSAWLVMDYGMRALLVEGGSAQFGVWNQIGCVTQPLAASSTVTQEEVMYIELGSGLVNNPNWTLVTTGGGSGGGAGDQGTPGARSASCTRRPGPAGEVNQFDCATQRALCTAGGGISTVNAAGNILTCTPRQVVGTSGGGGGSCRILNSGPCSVANLRPIFGSRAEDASIICNKESGGNPIESRSDICCGPGGNCSGAPSFSGGLFQINILAHANLIPGCNLSSFFTRNGSSAQGNCVRRNGSNVCTGWSCSIVRNAAYNTCMQGARNTATNLRVTKILYDSRGFQPWANSRRICSVR